MKGHHLEILRNDSGRILKLQYKSVRSSCPNAAAAAGGGGGGSSLFSFLFSLFHLRCFVVRWWEWIPGSS